MLPESIRTLIVDEQARQGDLFVETGDLNEYLAKLADRAEILLDWAGGRCRGFVAFYCNDNTTKQAFITLVLVDPRDRRLGVGRALVDCALNVARRRGFTSCRLEVSTRNEVAREMYVALGFRLVENRTDKLLLEIGL